MSAKVKRTPARKRAPLFNRRIVISVPPWGVLVMSAAIGVAIFDRFAFITEIISLFCALAAVLSLWIARRMVRQMRYEIHEALRDIGNDDQDAPVDEDEGAEIFDIGSRKSG